MNQKRKVRRSAAAVLTAMAMLVLTMAPAQAASPPPNDLFENATEITLDFSEVVDTSMATTGESADLAAQEACGSPPPDASVWWSLTVDSIQRVLLSSAPPTFSSGFNVVVETPGGFECVSGGPVEVSFIAEPGTTYLIQSIDDQGDGGGNGGMLSFSAKSLGAPLPELCPGIAPDDPNLPPGLNLIVGTDGDDEIQGTSGDDLIFGLDGDDEIDGGGGNDVIWGCGGDDEIDGGNGNDVIFGDSADFFGDPSNTNGGDDEIDGGNGDDEIRGGPGNDELEGGKGDDGIFGNQGDDEIDGGRGDDFVVGGFGDDEVDGGKGDDGVFGGFGNDELDGGSGDDFVNGDAPNGQPDPNPNHDECDGGGGADTLENCESIDSDDDD